MFRAEIEAVEVAIAVSSVDVAGLCAIRGGAGETFSSFKIKERVFRVELDDVEVAIAASSVDVAGLCAIRGGVNSSTSEPSLMTICSIASLSKALRLALGMSAPDGLSSGLRAHNRIKKVSDCLPILLGNI